MKDNTVIDAARGVMHCDVCGDSVPVPCGDIHWAAAVMRAFKEAHSAPMHGAGRTRLSTPRHADGGCDCTECQQRRTIEKLTEELKTRAKR